MSKNLLSFLKRQSHWKQTNYVCKTLTSAGFKAWLAGGAVRDLILKVKPKDFDIATDATPEEIEKLFSKTINVGKDFGAIKVVYKKATVDVVSFRKDGLYIDGRRPTTIERSTPEEDALRRDFTANALFLDPLSGKIYDYVGGLTDIKNKSIRAVGDAGFRFEEDKLRMLRAVRFVSQLGFKLDTQTHGAIRRMAPQIHIVSGERIYEETSKLLSGKYLYKALQLLTDTGLSNELFKIHEFDLKRTKKIKFVTPLNLKWVYLLSHLDELKRHNLYERLKISHSLKNFIEDVLKLANEIKNFNSLNLAQKKQVASQTHIKQAVEFYTWSNKLDAKTKSFLAKNAKLPKPLITSTTLMKHGVKPGKLFGHLLHIAFEAQLNEEFKTQKQALIWLDKQLHQGAK